MTCMSLFNKMFIPLFALDFMIPRARSLYARHTSLLAVPSICQMCFFYLRVFVFVVPSVQNAPSFSGCKCHFPSKDLPGHPF